MTKTEKIQEAHGEYFERLKGFIDNNGWVKRGHYHFLKSAFTEEQIKENYQVTVEIDNDKMFRPKSLQGIENNNGWIKIESEADLPIKDCNCHIEFLDGSVTIDRFFITYKMFNANHWKHIVAYRIITEPLKRVY